MFSRDKWRKFLDQPWVEWGLFALGVLLITLGLLIAPLPGPGGVFLIAPGAALILKTSMWAKRHYVKFKRWQPKVGRWADWGLQRRSARRREAIRKERREMHCPLPADEANQSAVEAELPDPPVDPAVKVHPNGCGD
jgi:hypothetical protein